MPSRDLARRARLSDLLREREHAHAAADVILPGVTPALPEPSVRFRAARALLDAGEPARADEALGALTEIASVYGPWFALHGTRLLRAGDTAGADKAFRVGIAVDPLSEDVACEGERAREGKPAKFPSLPERDALCRAARERPRD
jgi:Flp pilus assembly protein TadD